MDVALLFNKYFIQVYKMWLSNKNRFRTFIEVGTWKWIDFDAWEVENKL